MEPDVLAMIRDWMQNGSSDNDATFDNPEIVENDGERALLVGVNGVYMSIKAETF